MHECCYRVCTFCFICSEEVIEDEVPSGMSSLVETKRHELIEAVANVDEKLCDMYLSDQIPSPSELRVRIIHHCIYLTLVHRQLFVVQLFHDHLFLY